MTKAVGYVGADGGSAAASGPPAGQDAPDAQRGRIWAWCKAQGMPLDDIHAESDPADTGRPALQAALVSAAGGVLVVDTLAALAPTVGALAGVVGRLHDAGTRLVALSEGLDTASDPEGMAIRMLQAAACLAPRHSTEAPFGFADAAPEAPAAPPDEAAIDSLLGTAPAPSPEPVDDPFGAPVEDADRPSGPFSPTSAPVWGDLPLDGGRASDAPPAAETPSPEGMRIPLEQIEDAVEAAADAVSGMAEAADGMSASDAPDAPHRALRAVSPIQDDLVPSEGPADPADPSLPPPPAPSAATDAALPTYGAGSPRTRARHRRESDYAVTAEKASRYLQKGKLDKAAAIWNDFLKGAEGNNAGRGWNHLGDIRARARRNVEAADAWLKAAAAFESAHYNHMAVATLKKVIKLDPGRPEVYRSLAELNARCDRVGDAVEAYLRYARFLKDGGRLAEALEMFCRIRILDPVNARHRMQLAEELFAFGFEGEAAREAVHAADLLLERGDHGGAEAHLARWSERIPGHAGLSLRLTAMSGGESPARVPPAAGIEGGVLLTSGGAGRSRSDDPGWRRESPG